MRIPNSRQAALLNRVRPAIPKMPVAANIAPITPSTPSDTAAIRESKTALRPLLGSMFWMKNGQTPESPGPLSFRPDGCPPVPADCWSRRTTSHVSLEGNCRNGQKNIAGGWLFGDVSRYIFPSSHNAPPLECAFPSFIFVSVGPVRLFCRAETFCWANNRFTMATRGRHFMSSCHVKSLPDNNGVACRVQVFRRRC